MQSFIRTDMALEARERHTDIPGVTEHRERNGSTTVTTIEIKTEQAADTLGKPRGVYVTIEEPGIAERRPAAFRSAVRAAAKALSLLIGTCGQEKPVLIIGLGNRAITADALGPRVVSKLFVTRHIMKTMPDLVPEGLPSVAAAAPGVLGVTGIETLEFIRGLIREVSPGSVLCIDALASLRASRINTSIQINDSGIFPGAGVGNNRQGINRETLGLPVFAVGVPTVVHAHTIVAETVAQMSGTTGNELDELTQSIAQTMDRLYGEMIVTTKDVDQMLEDAADILSEAINRALFAQRYPEIQALLS